jgi:hypothetical protein
LRRRTTACAFSFSLLMVACAAEKAPAPSGDLEAPAVKAGCVTPKQGMYSASLKAKNSCPWWADAAKSSSDLINFDRDSIHYPFTDDVCGSIQWSGCTVRDDCGPIRLNAGDNGYIAKGSMVATFTDDQHATGTVRYDVGVGCTVELDFTAELLPL